MKTQTLILVALVGLFVRGSALGQTTGAQNGSSPRLGQAVRSPEVQSDGRVTFRYRAPYAKNVVVARDDAPQMGMAVDAQGIWSVTTEPLPPDIYTYRFVVDGVAIADPANSRMKSIVTGGSESMVEVPGGGSLSWEVNAVPHGSLHRHWFHSVMVGENRDLWVYTPPGYDPSRKQTYPVLYLLHGVMEDASAWTSAGQAQVILDNLIAQGRAKPMLIVMPMGYGFANVPDRMIEQFGGPKEQKRIMDVFATSLLNEVMPQVERGYRVKKGAGATAIAGVSMGGSQALYIGLKHPKRFGWIGAFSPAVIMYGEPYGAWFPDRGPRINSGERLLWIACGTEDFLLGANRKFEGWLTSSGVRFTAGETPGGHVWPVWRRHLTQFAPLLFR